MVPLRVNPSHRELDLLEQRSFEQGVTMHRYAIRNEGEATPC